MLIDYGDEWQKAWDEHVKNWQPTNPENDHNNLTMWTKFSESSIGKRGYVRAEELNSESIIQTMEERIADPLPHGISLQCTMNVNHEVAYLSAPKTIPFFRRLISKIDMSEDSDDKHTHKCNVTERYKASERYGLDEDEDDSEDESGDEEEHDDGGEYMYTVRIEVQKPFMDEDSITEVHEIRDVPRSSISFVNGRYTSDVFLKNSFRHEMMLPDAIFPTAWMNVMP